MRRQFEALLQVSLASATQLEPREQARLALDEVVRVLGAERGFLLVCPDGGGALSSLTVACARSKDGSDIGSGSGYSTSIVEKVLTTRQAVVVTATDRGEVTASESIVAADLRSILAAPMLLRDRFVGVVYVDTSISSGVFTLEDLGIIGAIASHVAIGFETARTAKLEIEKRELAKDLEVTAAVQTLLLPAVSSLSTASYDVDAIYNSAVQSGGDWWWREKRPDGRVRILLGDVTGHGAGAAMVTAAIAGAYNTLRSSPESDDMTRVIEVLDKMLSQLCRGEYLMTLAAIEADPVARTVTLYSAGAPAMLIRRSDGVESISSPGNPLGLDDSSIGSVTAPFGPGDCLYAFTDGVFELETIEGKSLGLKGLRKIVAQHEAGNAGDACRLVIEAVQQQTRGGRPDDDMTIVALVAKSTTVT